MFIILIELIKYLLIERGNQCKSSCGAAAFANIVYKANGIEWPGAVTQLRVIFGVMGCM